MGKVKRVLTGILDGKVELTNVHKYSTIAFLVGFVHLVLLVFFSYFKITPLIVANIFSVIIYLSMQLIIRKECYLACFIITYCEICIHTILATAVLGQDLAFTFYNFLLIPVSYYISFTTNTFRKKLMYPVILTFINLIITLICTVFVFYVRDSQYVLTEVEQFILYSFNIIVTFIFFTGFSILFVVEIRNRQYSLTRKNEELNYYAQCDPLTSLLNRRSMQEKIAGIIKDMKEEDKFCIVLSDIDDFKRVNDTYGHECGDKALVHISSTLKGLLSSEDSLCRWGGEEFLFVLRGDMEMCNRKTELMRSAVEKIDFYYKRRRVKFTMTFGIEEHDIKRNIEQTISRADRKLYKGKQSGKNCVVYH